MRDDAARVEELEAALFALADADGAGVLDAARNAPSPLSLDWLDFRR